MKRNMAIEQSKRHKKPPKQNVSAVFCGVIELNLYFMIYKTSKVLESHNEHLYNLYILIIKAKCWFCSILIHYSLLLSKIACMIQ